ncbi:hypothetical protein MHBO_002036, partial [Bonamia ostreae]
ELHVHEDEQMLDNALDVDGSDVEMPRRAQSIENAEFGEISQERIRFGDKSVPSLSPPDLRRDISLEKQHNLRRKLEFVKKKNFLRFDKKIELEKSKIENDCDRETPEEEETLFFDAENVMTRPFLLPALQSSLFGLFDKFSIAKTAKDALPPSKKNKVLDDTNKNANSAQTHFAEDELSIDFAGFSISPERENSVQNSIQSDIGDRDLSGLNESTNALFSSPLKSKLEAENAVKGKRSKMLIDKIRKAEKTTFKKIAADSSRKTTAGVFFELLCLKSRSLIECEQKEIWGEIVVTVN